MRRRPRNSDRLASNDNDRPSFAPFDWLSNENRLSVHGPGSGNRQQEQQIQERALYRCLGASVFVLSRYSIDTHQPPAASRGGESRLKIRKVKQRPPRLI